MNRWQMSCGEGLCVLWSSNRPQAPMFRLLRNHLAHLQKTVPLSPAPLRYQLLPVAGEYSMKLIQIRPDVSMHWVISLVNALRGGLIAPSCKMCFVDIFHLVVGRAPSSPGSLHWLSHLHFQCSLHEGSVYHRQPFFPLAINFHHLADWLTGF